MNCFQKKPTPRKVGRSAPVTDSNLSEDSKDGGLMDGTSDKGVLQTSWGPVSETKVLQKPERIFQAKDSVDMKITGCDVSLDGTFMVFAQKTGGFKAFAQSSGRTFTWNYLSIHTLALWTPPDNSYTKMLVSGDDKMLHVWELHHRVDDCRERTEVPLNGECFTTAFSVDGSHAACGGREFFQIIRLQSEETVYRKRFERESVYACNFHPIDSSLIAIGGSPGVCQLVRDMNCTCDRNAANCTCDDVNILQLDHREPVTTIEFDPTGNILMMGGGAHVSLHRLKMNNLHRQLEEQMAGESLKDFCQFSSGRDDTLVETFRTFTHPDFPSASRTQLGEDFYKCSRCDIPGVRQARFSRDAQKIIVAGGDSVIIWHVQSGGLLHRFCHPEPVNTCCFTPDGNSICAGGDDWQVTVRDTKPELEIKRVFQQGIEGISNDGGLYAMTDIQGEGEVRSLKTNEQVFPTQRACVGTAIISPHSTFLAMKTTAMGAADLPVLGLWTLNELPQSFHESAVHLEISDHTVRNDGSHRVHHIMWEQVFPRPETWTQSQKPEEFDIDAMAFTDCERYLAVAVGFNVLIKDLRFLVEHCTPSAYSRYLEEQEKEAVKEGEKRPMPMSIVAYRQKMMADADRYIRLDSRTRSPCLRFGGESGNLTLAIGVMFKGFLSLVSNLSVVREFSPDKKDMSSANKNFDLLDTDGDGVVEFDEFKDAAANMNQLLYESDDFVYDEDATVRHLVSGFKCSIEDMDFSPTGRQIAAAAIQGSGSKILIFDSKSGEWDKELQNLRTCRFEPSGKFLIGAERKNARNIVLYDIEKWEVVRRLVFDAEVNSVDFTKSSLNPDSEFNICARTTDGIQIWDYSRLICLPPPTNNVFETKYDDAYTQCIVKQHPNLLYEVCEKHNDMTFVQYLTFTSTHKFERQQLERLLKISPHSMLVPLAPVHLRRMALESGTAMDLAIEKRDRELVHILLDATLKTEQSAARASLVRVIPRLINDYPDLVAIFFQGLELEDCVEAQINLQDGHGWVPLKECKFSDSEPTYKALKDQSAARIWNAEVLRREKTSQTKKAVVAKRVPLPGIADGKILQALISRDTTDPVTLQLFDNDITQAIIMCLWNVRVRNIFLKRFALHSTVFFMWIWWTSVVGHEARAVSQAIYNCVEDYNGTRPVDIHDVHDAIVRFGNVDSCPRLQNILDGQKLDKFIENAVNLDNIRQTICTVVDFFLMIQGMLGLSIESMQCQSEGITNYVSDFYNLIDIACMAMMIAGPVLHQFYFLEYLDKLVVIGAVLSIVIGLKTFFYCRAFDGTGFMVRMMIDIVGDLQIFLGFALLLMVTFSSSMFLLLSYSVDGGSTEIDPFGDDDNDGDDFYPFETFDFTLFQMWMMFNGDWDVTMLYYNSLWPSVTLCVFTIYVFVGLIMMLNIIIAILSETFNRVNTTRKPMSLMERTYIINENLQEMDERSRVRFIEGIRWIHRLQPVDANDAAEGDEPEPEASAGSASDQLKEFQLELNERLQNFATLDFMDRGFTQLASESKANYKSVDAAIRLIQANQNSHLILAQLEEFGKRFDALENSVKELSEKDRSRSSRSHHRRERSHGRGSSLPPPAAETTQTE